jgi:hypothetical protein
VFVLIGLVVSVVANRRGAVSLVYGIACGLLLLFAVWGAGYRLEDVGVIPLLLAMVFYGVPFWLVATHAAGTSTKLNRVRASHDDPSSRRHGYRALGE